MKKLFLFLLFFLLHANAYSTTITLQPGSEGKDSTEYYNYSYPYQHGNRIGLGVSTAPTGQTN